jgi:hypothetical protein
MKNTVLWDVTPCSLVNIYRYFGGTICLYLHGIRVNRAKKSGEFLCKRRVRTLHGPKGLRKMVKKFVL